METLKVLITDDEPGMRLGVMRTLRDFNVYLPEVDAHVRFDVAQAETGEQALERIASDEPHILLLDHKLPGMSGLDVLDHLRTMNTHMLTVMVTAYATLETAVSATKRGAYDFLAKPFTPDELKSTVCKAAGRVVLAQQARKLAEEKQQVRFDFIRVLAHELKAPLSAVEGYLGIIMNHTAGDDPDAYEHMIGRCIVRMGQMRKLIIDLLDLTRMESGRKKRELTQIDVAEVTRHAIETATPAALERNVSINLEAQGDLQMIADRSEIEIALNNLISNAVKYNTQGGRVDVALHGNLDTVTISVADTGIGMTADDIEKLFTEFVRIRNEKTRNIFGSGLGLSIVKKLAHLYGGDVIVKSAPDQGSTFTLTLRKDMNPEATDESE